MTLTQVKTTWWDAGSPRVSIAVTVYPLKNEMVGLPM
jgi:hypothetical protein